MSESTNRTGAVPSVDFVVEFPVFGVRKKQSVHILVNQELLLNRKELVSVRHKKFMSRQYLSNDVSFVSF